MEILRAFIAPYFKFIVGAAFSVQQTLEGSRLWTAGFAVRDEAGRVVGGYWSPTQAVALPLLGLSIYSFVLLLVTNISR